MRNDTQEVLSKYKVNVFGAKDSIRKAENLLFDNESILFLTPTNAVIQSAGRKKEKVSGVFLVTDKRVILNFVNGTDISYLDKVDDVTYNGNPFTGGHINVSFVEDKFYDIIFSYDKVILEEIQEVILNAVERYRESEKVLEQEKVVLQGEQETSVPPVGAMAQEVLQSQEGMQKDVPMHKKNTLLEAEQKSIIAESAQIEEEARHEIPSYPIPNMQMQGMPNIGQPVNTQYGVPSNAMPNMQMQGMPNIGQPVNTQYGAPSYPMPNMQMQGMPNIGQPVNTQYGAPSYPMPNMQMQGMPNIGQPVNTQYGAPSYPMPNMQIQGTPDIPQSEVMSLKPEDRDKAETVNFFETDTTQGMPVANPFETPVAEEGTVVAKPFETPVAEEEMAVANPFVMPTPQETISEMNLSEAPNEIGQGEAANQSQTTFGTFQPQNSSVFDVRYDQENMLEQEQFKTFDFVQVEKIGEMIGNNEVAPLAVLEKLARLKELGILTEEEFREKKEKLMEEL